MTEDGKETRLSNMGAIGHGILNLFRSPSAYIDDPIGYLRNQLGHAYIVGFLPVLLFGWPAIPFVVMGYVFWEYLQVCWFGATLSDALEDTGHVALGSVSAVFFPAIVPHIVLIAAGYQWRKENAG